jgi:hypothetical protein
MISFSKRLIERKEKSKIQDLATTNTLPAGEHTTRGKRNETQQQ